MMAGGDSQNLDPGRFVSVVTPLMKILGLGISARGGALGPMLVGSGELIDEGYQSRRQSAVLKQLASLQRPVQETASTPGLPGTLSRLPAPLSAEADPEAFARLGTPDVASVPGQPALPPTSRTWTRERTRPEILQDIAAMPEGTLRNLTLQEVMRLKLPSDIERPKAVTDDLAAARASEEETRKGRVFTTALEPGATPATRGAAAAAGLLTPEPPPTEKWIQSADGTMQRVDPRTGAPLAPPVEQRTAEQTQARTELMTTIIPQAEAKLTEMVRSGMVTPKEASALQAQLVEARRTGDMKGYVQELGKIASARAKTGPGMRLSTRRTTTAAHPVTNPDIINNYKPFVPDVVSALTQRGYVGFDDPKTGNVRSPSGKTLTKEQAVSEVFQMWYGYRPDLQRDNAGTLTLKGLWIPEHVSQSETESGPEPPPSEAAGGE